MGGSCAALVIAQPAQCSVNLQCVGLFSGWTQADTNGDFQPDADCSATVACNANQVCVDGAGRCATRTSAFGGNCPQGFQQQTVPPLGGGPGVQVCSLLGAVDATCNSGTCVNPCAVDDDCPGDLRCRADGQCTQCLGDTDCSARAGSVCIDETFCGCENDTGCVGSPQGGFCIAAIGICGCAGNADCDGEYGGDVCTAGFCGCDVAGDCNGTAIFDETAFECSARPTGE